MTGFELKEAKTELEFVKDRFYDFPEETNASNSINNIQNAIKSIEELEEYYAIGTVEECREARERQKGKKPIIKSKKKTKIQTGDYVDVKCPFCEEDVFSCFHYPPWNDSQKSHKHCENCGQAIDWSDTP